MLDACSITMDRNVRLTVMISPPPRPRDGKLAEWLNAAVLKTAERDERSRGSNP